MSYVVGIAVTAGVDVFVDDVCDVGVGDDDRIICMVCVDIVVIYYGDGVCDEYSCAVRYVIVSGVVSIVIDGWHLLLCLIFRCLYIQLVLLFIVRLCCRCSVSVLVLVLMLVVLLLSLVVCDVIWCMLLCLLMCDDFANYVAGISMTVDGVAGVVINLDGDVFSTVTVVTYYNVNAAVFFIVFFLALVLLILLILLMLLSLSLSLSVLVLVAVFMLVS